MKLVQPIAPQLSSRVLGDFVADFGLEQPKRVRIQPAAGGIEDHCYVNVANRISEIGGRGTYGWKIIEFPHLFLQAIHHSVWVDGSGRMIDVTPDVRNWKSHVFSPANGQTFLGVPVSAHTPLFKNISGLAEVDEAIEISKKLTEMQIKRALPSGMLGAIDNQDPLVNELSHHALGLLALAQAKVGRK